MFQPRVKDASIPVLAIKIYLFLDVPHMLKLARNLLHDWKEISVPGFQKPACWKFIQLLYEYQMEIGLRAYGNRLTNKHIYFDRMIDLRFFFPATENHDQDPANYEIHVMTLAKCVVKRYFRIRCLSYLKMLNQKHNPDPSIRNAILKKLQFTGL